MVSISEYYVPASAEPKPVIEGLQTITVRLKEETIVKYLSQTIYSSWTSAIRELYANELTAAKKAARMGANPTIEVTLDPETRELIIWGKDSLGITGEKFKVLRYYGRSGNFSGEDAGQFGFGFKSFCLLNDTMRVETHARETGERFGFIAERGVEFRPIADEELTIENYGTKVSLTIRPQLEDGQGEGKEIRLEEVLLTLDIVCRFAEVDTHLNLTSTLKKRVKYSWGSHEYEETVREAGRQKLNFTPKKYARESFGDKGYDFDLDTEDFHFYGYLGPYRDDGEVNVTNVGEVRLVGMPISATIGNPNPRNESDSSERPSYPMSFWVVNLKDERKFSPTADRERLRDGVFDPVNEKIIQFLKGEFRKMEIKSFADYKDSPYRPILDTHGDSKIKPYLTDETSRTCAALSTSVGRIANEDEEGERRGGRRGYAPPGAYETQLRELVLRSSHVFMLKRKRKERGYMVPLKTALTLRKILRHKYPDAEVFLHPGFSFHSYNSNNDDTTAAENSRRVLME
ncbi:MAG: hypothetical protein ACRD6W_08910, partial [Nitrososphaerales archaeon]